MVVLKAKYVVGELRKLRNALGNEPSPNTSWLDEVSPWIEMVFEHREDLAKEHRAFWQRRDGSRADYQQSLDQIIRALNFTDEVSFSGSPVMVLTLIGIGFLVSLVVGAWAYYTYFIRP